MSTLYNSLSKDFIRLEYKNIPIFQYLCKKNENESKN